LEKKIIFFLLILLFCSLPNAFSGEFSFSLNLSWELSLRCGFEYRIYRFLGIAAHGGFAFYGLISADAAVVFYFFQPASPVQINICAGIPNASFVPDPSYPACMISVGASLLAGYRFAETYVVYIKIGGGFPFFFEEDKDIIRDIKFPLGLWPDFVLGINIKI
jgi:hypothetical protein